MAGIAKSLFLSDEFYPLVKVCLYTLGNDCALLLNVLVEADKLLADEDGWFYQTIETIERFSTLKRSKQDKAIKTLLHYGIIEQQNRGIPMKRYFRINDEVLEDFIKSNQCVLKTGYVETYQPTLSKNNKLISRESTTNKEITNKKIKNKRLTASDETVSLPLDIYSLLEKSNLSDNTYTAIARFIDMYYRYYGKQHPKIKQDNWNLVVERFDDLAEDKNLDPYCEYAGLDLFDEKYLAYFEKYQQSKANIYHFTRALTSIDGDLKYTYQHIKEMSMR